MKSTEDKISH